MFFFFCFFFEWALCLKCCSAAVLWWETTWISKCQLSSCLDITIWKASSWRYTCFNAALMLARGPLRPSPLRHAIPPLLIFTLINFNAVSLWKTQYNFPLTRQFSFNVSSQTKRVMFTPTQWPCCGKMIFLSKSGDKKFQSMGWIYPSGDEWCLGEERLGGWNPKKKKKKGTLKSHLRPIHQHFTVAHFRLYNLNCNCRTTTLLETRYRRLCSWAGMINQPTAFLEPLLLIGSS